MLYRDYRDAIERALKETPDGLTWAQLKESLELPQKRACPEWTSWLEREIGLKRVKGVGRALVWKIDDQ